MSEHLNEMQRVKRLGHIDISASWEERFAREHARCIYLEQEILRLKAELQRTRIQVVSARQMALHDDLTLLPNRTLFRERVRSALAANGDGPAPVAVLYLDLNGFKQINDTYGHDVGDKVLNIVGTRLARAVRAEDTVSRLGGDEFGCLLTGLSGREDLRQRASTLIDAVSARVKIGGHVVRIQGSAGMATAPADGTTLDDLLKSADAAMYRAKKGKGGIAWQAQVSWPRIIPR